MGDAKIDTSRLEVKPQNLNDAYAVPDLSPSKTWRRPANFLEIDITNAQTHGVGKNRYTDYEVRMKVAKNNFTMFSETLFSILSFVFCYCCYSLLFICSNLNLNLKLDLYLDVQF